VCANTATVELLHQAAIPTNNVVLCATRAEATAWPRGSFRLLVCERCGFVFNGDFDARLVEYSARIEETQAFSPHFLRYAEWLAQDWIARYDLRGRTVLEVGCGKAEFLSILCRLGDNEGIGYDPATHVERLDADVADRVTLVADYFGDAQREVDAAALVCRHTLEHIPQVHEFLKMLHRWATAHPGAVLLFEVPDVERVFREDAFWDLFYEHSSYFTNATLRWAFEHSGFEVLAVRPVYDDQYLVLEARLRADDGPPPLPVHAPGVVELARQFAERQVTIASVCRANLEQLRRHGQPVALWGGGSKAVSFLTTLDVADLVDFVVDVNPHKQGRYLVGTGHEILGPAQLATRPPAQIVVMNPVYRAEIGAQLHELGVAATLHSANDLLEPAFAV
jgi:SAM-dependent methyltransferase